MMRWPLFFTALLFLLTGSYLDNIRGPLMPILNNDLSIRYDQSVWLFVAAGLGAISSGLYLKLTESWGIQRAKIFGITVGVLTALTGWFVSGIGSLCVFGFLLGGTVASLGTLANLLVFHATPPERRGLAFNGLHSMYGIASAVGPSIVPIILLRGWPWQVALLPSLILTLVLAIIPTRIPEGPNHSTPTATPTAKPVGRLGNVIVATFVVYVMGEILNSIWIVSFLVETRGYSVNSAAPYLTLFFIAMAVSRLLAIRTLSARWETRVMWASLGVFLLCQIIGITLHPIGLSLSGLVGPFFPLLMARMTCNLGSASQTVMLRLFLAIPICSASANFLLGQASKTIALDRLFWVCPAFGLATMILFAITLSLEGSLGATRDSKDPRLANPAGRRDY